MQQACGCLPGTGRLRGFPPFSRNGRPVLSLLTAGCRRRHALVVFLALLTFGVRILVVLIVVVFIFVVLIVVVFIFVVLIVVVFFVVVAGAVVRRMVLNVF